MPSELTMDLVRAVNRAKNPCAILLRPDCYRELQTKFDLQMASNSSIDDPEAALIDKHLKVLPDEAVTKLFFRGILCVEADIKERFKVVYEA